MIRLPFRRIIWFSILISLSTAVLLQCVPQQEENIESERKLEQAIRRIENKAMNDSLTIDIVELTNFDWNKLYTFRNPESPQEMKKYPGIDWGGARKLYEKDNLFIFVKDQKVVAHIFFEGSDYDKQDFFFDGYTRRSSFTPEDAKFVVKKGGGLEPFIIKMYPLRYVANL